MCRKPAHSEKFYLIRLSFDGKKRIGKGGSSQGKGKKKRGNENHTAARKKYCVRVKKKPSVKQTEGVNVLSNSFSSLTAAEFSDTQKRRKTDGDAVEMR